MRSVARDGGHVAGPFADGAEDIEFDGRLQRRGALMRLHHVKHEPGFSGAALLSGCMTILLKVLFWELDKSRPFSFLSQVQAAYHIDLTGCIHRGSPAKQQPASMHHDPRAMSSAPFGIRGNGLLRRGVVPGVAIASLRRNLAHLVVDALVAIPKQRHVGANLVVPRPK